MKVKHTSSTNSCLNGASILVTGAAGFIGRNLLERLVQLGCKPHAIVRSKKKAWRLKSIIENIQIHEADITNEEKLEAIFKKVKPQYIFHLAVSRGNSESIHEEMFNLNVLGSIAIIRLSRKYGVKKLVVAGSSLEYASSEKALSETDALSPLTWHGVTKAAGCLFFKQAALTQNLPLVYLRLFHVYGPWESSHRLGPTAIKAAINGNEIQLTETGIRRDWVFVDDVCEAFIRALEINAIGQVLNIGSGDETSNEGFLECVRSVTGRKINISNKQMPSRVTDVSHRYANTELARNVLDWEPKYSLYQGVSKTIDWYNHNSEAWSMSQDLRPILI